jgi:hypothetical protein
METEMEICCRFDLLSSSPLEISVVREGNWIGQKEK